MAGRILVRCLWIAAAVAALVFLLRAFFLDVYRVVSGSMEPTLHGPDARSSGERVLVAYDHGAKPARFDLVVVLVSGESEPIVKRVAAFGGESVMISGGDLWIDGKRLPPEAARPELIPIFDEARQPLADGFPKLAELPASREHARVIEGTKPQRFDFTPRATDGYFATTGEWVKGALPVNDLALEFDLARMAPGAKFTALLTEEGDRMSVEFEAGVGGVLGIRLIREGTNGAISVVDERRRELDLVARHHARFSNVDNVLSLELDGVREVEASYPSNTPVRNAPDPFYRHLLPRAQIGATGSVEVANLRLLRDIDYTSLGEHAIETPLELGPDEVFLLGDHSSESRDSRSFGPLKKKAIIGHPVAVIWPWKSARALHPVRKR